jgi:hypothetical protein
MIANLLNEEVDITSDVGRPLQTKSLNFAKKDGIQGFSLWEIRQNRRDLEKLRSLVFFGLLWISITR